MTPHPRAVTTGTVDLSEGERLLANATVGPWDADAWGKGADIRTAGGVDQFVSCGETEPAMSVADAEAIVWLRNNAAALLAELKELRSRKSKEDATT